MSNTINDILFGNEEEVIKVDRRLIQRIGLKGAILFTMLLGQHFNLVKTEDGYFCYFEKEINNEIGFSRYVQRKLLNLLIKNKLILTKKGNQGFTFIKIINEKNN